MGTSLLFGFYSGVVAIALLLIEYFTGMDRSLAAYWFGWIGLPFLILFIWMAMKERKQDDFGGTISYGHCVGTGSLVGLFAGIVIAIFMYVYLTSINPSFVDFITQQREAAMKSGQMTSERIEKATALMKRWFIPIEIGTVLIANVIFGVIISLIAGAFVKSKAEDSAFKAV
jgi:hypothetical protein